MSKYTDFDPLEILEQLSKQQKEMSRILESLIENHNNLASAFYEHDERLRNQALLLQTLRTRINELVNKQST